MAGPARASPERAIARRAVASNEGYGSKKQRRLGLARGGFIKMDLTCLIEFVLHRSGEDFSAEKKRREAHTLRTQSDAVCEMYAVGLGLFEC